MDTQGEEQEEEVRLKHWTQRHRTKLITELGFTDLKCSIDSLHLEVDKELVLFLLGSLVSDQSPTARL